MESADFSAACRAQILVIGGGLSGLVAALAAEFSGTGAVQLFEAERSLSGAGGRAELHRSVASARPTNGGLKKIRKLFKDCLSLG
ncbi:unnamed protein product [Durusdinium trenchii]|uniref:FAD-dependent oxidoreductase 2 FAD-binding domain-containing protein n=1 Tax=Durusdinium trenchii TaxID=1381693 RepID=A0ABP0JFH9_9DINO